MRISVPHFIKMTKKHFQTQLSDKKISEILQEDQAKEKEFQKRFQFYHGRVANRRKTEQMLKTSELGFLDTAPVVCPIKRSNELPFSLVSLSVLGCVVLGS